MKKNSLIEEIFYFIRNKDKRPAITVCLLFDKNIQIFLARGVAICSPKETPCIKMNAQQRNGPGLARKRAWRALEAEENIYEITRFEPIKTLNHASIDSPYVEFPGWSHFKGFFIRDKNDLSSKEQKLLERLLSKEI